MADFAEVKAAEKEEIKEARDRRDKLFAPDKLEMPSPREFDDAAGLAFSGGGIRSATFNLGILQGLARYNLLQRIDYISTVSGGGYIGSWLISWIRRWGFRNAIQGLASSPPSPPVIPGPPASVMRPAVPLLFDGTYREAPQINFLRAYSNYLTPRLGVLSADVWEAVSSYIRNLLLNLTILILALSVVLILPRLWEAIFFAIANYPSIATTNTHLSLGLAVAALFLLAVTSACWHIASNDFSSVLDSRYTKQVWVLLGVVAPLFAAASLGSIALWLRAGSLRSMQWGDWAFVGCIAYGVARTSGLILSVLLIWQRPTAGWLAYVRDACSVALWAFVAGGLGGVLVGWIAHKYYAWAPLAPGLPVPQVQGLAIVAFAGTLLLMGALLLTGVLHIGLMSLDFTNQKREWWARMTGWLLILCITCAVVFWLGIYAPLQVLLLGTLLKSALSGGWLASSLAGLLAGKSGSTSGTSGGRTKLEILAMVAPYVFILGLLIMLSAGIHNVVTSVSGSAIPSPSPKAETAKVTGELQLTSRDGATPVGSTLTELKLTYTAKPASERKVIEDKFWREAQKVFEKRVLGLPSWGWLLLLSLLLGGAALAFSARVDINEFSMHLFYRNRLVRCYLGASNRSRNPQRFTGFDPNDDTLLRDFSVNAKPTTYAGPYPILNCTLSITHGERLAWQERKGESFIFTPRYCGYEFQEQRRMKEKDELEAQRILALDFEEGEHLKLPKSDGYQPTGGYAYDGGVYLGTALATSGAAVNPNMGFHTSSALAFLLTVFNVRLGWWLGNPQDAATNKRATPRFGLFYLLMELFALTSDRSGYVNLSDGFHFENLGLYELVRRRCKYIIVGDAGADPEHSFDDLGNAIRKCRTDFGVEIELDTSPLKLGEDEEFTAVHAVRGKIHYELIYPNEQPGTLLYLKPTLLRDDPADILNYKTLHPAFPHQPTANQWFDESQFESYRQLGRVSIESMLERVGTPDMLRGMSVADIFAAL